MAALQAFGNIVLVFAILERFAPASEFKMDDEKKAWDPASLRKEAEPEDDQALGDRSPPSCSPWPRW